MQSNWSLVLRDSFRRDSTRPVWHSGAGVNQKVQTVDGGNVWPPGSSVSLLRIDRDSHSDLWFAPGLGCGRGVMYRDACI